MPWAAWSDGHGGNLVPGRERAGDYAGALPRTGVAADVAAGDAAGIDRNAGTSCSSGTACPLIAGRRPGAGAEAVGRSSGATAWEASMGSSTRHSDAGSQTGFAPKRTAHKRNIVALAGGWGGDYCASCDAASYAGMGQENNSGHLAIVSPTQETASVVRIDTSTVTPTPIPSATSTPRPSLSATPAPTPSLFATLTLTPLPSTAPTTTLMPSVPQHQRLYHSH